MGELIQFPRDKPESEERVGYCMNCGVECPWPMSFSAWPETCPNGCAPFTVMSAPPVLSEGIWVGDNVGNRWRIR